MNCSIVEINEKFGDLIVAIVEQACEDYMEYKHAIVSGCLRKRATTNCEKEFDKVCKFFRSEWGDFVCFGHALEILKKLEKDFDERQVIRVNYGETLLQFRAKHNLTQKQLADIIGVGVVMVCRYECGISKPTSVNKIRFENKMKEWEMNKNDLQVR